MSEESNARTSRSVELISKIYAITRGRQGSFFPSECDISTTRCALTSSERLLSSSLIESPIKIIYSARIRSHSPTTPPKRVKSTFPCPPEVNLPTERKLQVLIFPSTLAQ